LAPADGGPPLLPAEGGGVGPDDGGGVGPDEGVAPPKPGTTGSMIAAVSSGAGPACGCPLRAGPAPGA
jgi:hypothetical protein